MTFEVIKNDDRARDGVLSVRSFALRTPFFMPDATRASVRGLTNAQLQDVGIVPMVVNTYHLMLQPSASYLLRYGGIHAFMHWDGPLLSDSGGYQVYSLIHKNKDLGEITEEGARFRSIVDGVWHMLTPEKAIEIQFDIGTDMMVVLDDPRPVSASREDHENAVARTIRWARQCKEEFVRQCDARGYDEKIRPLLFGVVQGGMHYDLRRQCATALQEIDFDGYGFGGRHIDDEGVFMEDIITMTADILPQDKPRFALGIGTPEDIVRCHHAGWDLFDCVIPTREGRHGRVFKWRAHDHKKPLFGQKFYDVYNISNAQYHDDQTPLDACCDCYACTTYTRAYLQHLFRVSEPLAAHMIALHNLRFYSTMMKRLYL